MIRAEHLSKSFGAARPLADVSLDVAPGECVGVLGDGESGRTTLLRVLATLTKPSSGRLTIDGVDAVSQVDRVRPRIAYAGPGSADALRAGLPGEHLAFLRAARVPQARQETSIADVLARAGVDPALPLQAHSAAMRQRLALAAVLSSGADILVLDDPFAGLHPADIAPFLDWVVERRDRGTTLVAVFADAAHSMAVCHRRVVLEHGRLSGAQVGALA